MSYATYLTGFFNRTKQDKIIRSVRKIIKQKKVNFDGFVVTGVSGILIGSILSRSLKKELVIVRKEEDYKNSHTFYKVENYKSNKRYIFVDDLIASGSTFARVQKELKEFHKIEKIKGRSSKIIGTILYDDISYKKDVGFFIY